MVSREIKYDMVSLGFISIFESITHVKPKDFFESQGRMVFIVPAGLVGKAIGPRGANVKRLEQKLKKKIKIAEFNDDPVVFVGNYIMPLKVDNIERNDDEIIISGNDTKTKGLIIGRNAQNLRELENVVNRYFKVKEIKVI